MGDGQQLTRIHYECLEPARRCQIIIVINNHKNNKLHTTIVIIVKTHAIILINNTHNIYIYIY
jgi:hypothetical protein